MTKQLEVSGKYLVIAGFKGARIRDVHVLFENLHDRIASGHVQLFDANLVASWEHLYYAALNALRAFETDLSISKEPAIETLLYASGQHQIRKAVELLGVKPGSSNVAVLIIAETSAEANEALIIISDLLQGTICDEVLRLTDEKNEAVKELFGISHLELEAASREDTREKTLVNLVIEHVALLAARH